MAKEYKYSDILKNSGFRITEQRRAILDCLIEKEGEHLSSEEIHNLLLEKKVDIGVATVYRNLIIMEKLNLVNRVNLDDGRSRFEINKNREDHRHHHLLCTRCGKVDEMEDDLLEAIEEKILNKNGFKVYDHRVKFYGICKKCREAE